MADEVIYRGDSHGISESSAFGYGRVGQDDVVATAQSQLFRNEHIHVLKTKELIRNSPLEKWTENSRLSAERGRNFGDFSIKRRPAVGCRRTRQPSKSAHQYRAIANLHRRAVRILAQIKAIVRLMGSPLNRFTSRRRSGARERYKRRMSDMEELKTFSKEVSKNPTEAAVTNLKRARTSSSIRKRAHRGRTRQNGNAAGLFAREYTRLVDVIVGGQYGSEGKGTSRLLVPRVFSLCVSGPQRWPQSHSGIGSLCSPSAAVRNTTQHPGQNSSLRRARSSTQIPSLRDSRVQGRSQPAFDRSPNP